MDPQIILDYALFQLTPTRTRCDLIIFSGSIKEKLASGLVEPFISHIKFAKDQIPKGGYSITLRPPTNTHSPGWFTKSTFQRVVRFISTPEILERFLRIEQEILQIDCSVQSELSNTNGGHAGEGSLSPTDGITKKSPDSSKLKGENGGTNDGTQEESSKIRLQRLLETRKALLWKEQAMAYARALVAGFEMDNMNDLILFSDAFGASRLREACTDFKELCKKKHKDGLWMDELAAMATYSPAEFAYSGTSGIMLTSESSGTLVPNGSLNFTSGLTASQVNLEGNRANDLPASDQAPSTPAKIQVQMPWMNQIPQYMYNYQSPGQKTPQYQGYPFPSMQPMPPYYHGPMHWPQNVDESKHPPIQELDHHRTRRSSSRKKEKYGAKKPETSEEEEEIQSIDSQSNSDEHDAKNSSMEKPTTRKHRKKSSKTVVIRNINYITSKKRNGETGGVSDDSSSVDDELFDEDGLKQKVNDAVESLSKHHKSKLRNNKKKGEQRVPSMENEGTKDNAGWDALRNLLMRDEKQQESNLHDEHFAITSAENGAFAKNDYIDPECEKVTMQRKITSDSFVVTERNGGNEGRVNFEDFTNGESLRPITKRGSTDADLIMSRGLEEPERTLSDFVSESSVIRNSKGEDWFVVNHSGVQENRGTNIEKATFDGDYALEGNRFHQETSKKIAPIDDSFMVQARESADDQYDSQWKTVISMVEDFSALSHAENQKPDASQVKLERTHEPDDPCMVLVRDSGLGSAGAAWTPEMDYGLEIPFTKADKKSAPVETNDEKEVKIPKPVKGTNNKKNEARPKDLSLSKTKFDALSRSKKALSKPMVQKSKLEQEEEIRKRMEEASTERQKRIAERTAASKSKVAVSANSEAKKLSSPKVGPTKVAKGLGVLGQKKQVRI
ncbi:hypothetical protein LguiB_034100 [Lonicera macranthoides]